MLKKIITFILFVVIISSYNHCYKENTIYEAHGAYNSLEEWQRATTKSRGNFLDIITSFWTLFYKCILDKSFIGAPYDYANYCLPTVIAMDIDLQEKNECRGKPNRESVSSDIPFIILTIGSILTIGITVVLPALSLLYIASTFSSYARDKFFSTIDSFFGSCVTSFVMTPTEYIGLKEGFITFKDGGFQYSNGFFQNMIPYFFHCDVSEADILNYSQLNKEEKYDMSKKFYGYLGNGLCQDPGFASYGKKYKNNIGSIVLCKVKYDDIYNGANNIQYDDAFVDKYCVVAPKENNPNDLYKVESQDFSFSTFYKTSGSVSRCAIKQNQNVSIIWNTIGCSDIAPPVIFNSFEIRNMKLLDNTRCRYIGPTVRNDYYSVGMELLRGGGIGPSASSVPRFLISDFHPFDTLIGCISDLLNQMISVDASGDHRSFFDTIQHSLRPIVLFMLSLYLISIGIKMLHSGGQTNKTEMMMYIMKILLVALLGLSDIWSPSNNIINDPNQQSNRIGLYTLGTKIMERAVSMFLNISATYDPLKMCYYPYKDGNLLRSVVFKGGSNIISTPSQDKTDGVIFTPWTLLECKFMNLINWGSCNYELSMSPVVLLIGVQFISISKFILGIFGAIVAGGSGLNGLLLAIMSLGFILFAILLFGSYIYSILLSIIAFTTLVIIAPIMSAFCLFDITKDLFSNWLKSLIAYTIFPALLASQVVFVLLTMDGILYGNVDYIINNRDGTSNVREMCQDNDSLFCKMIDGKNVDHPCIGGTNMDFVHRTFNFNDFSVSANAFQSLFKPFLYLILFAYLMMYMGNQIGGFISGLLNLPNISNFSGINSHSIKGGLKSMKDIGKSFLPSAETLKGMVSSKNKNP